jgi:hypothetical protein
MRGGRIMGRTGRDCLKTWCKIECDWSAEVSKTWRNASLLITANSFFFHPPGKTVAHNHPARFLRGFVDRLDLAALGFAMPVAEGRPPYHPSLLLQIWLYGYFHRLLVEENPQAQEPGYRLPAGLAKRQAVREQIKEGLAQLQADGRTHYHRPKRGA